LAVYVTMINFSPFKQYIDIVMLWWSVLSVEETGTLEKTTDLT